MFQSYNLLWSLQELYKKKGVLREHERPDVFVQGNIAGSRSQGFSGVTTVL